MTLNDVLLALISHLRIEKDPIIIDWEETLQWPTGALETFLETGILSSSSNAKSIECKACDNHCFMDVITLPSNDPDLNRAFIVCDDPDMQNQMGRIQISLNRLQQWQSSIKQVSFVISDLLGFKDKILFPVDNAAIRLGMLKSLKGRRWVSLNSTDLSLEINQHSIPIDELLYFDGQQLVIDQDCVNYLLNRKPKDQGKKYTPSTTRREAGKLKTQAMHQDWNDEYLKLQDKHPTKSKKWCAIQISKMDIAQGKDAETIRKNMIM